MSTGKAQLRRHGPTWITVHPCGAIAITPAWAWPIAINLAHRHEQEHAHETRRQLIYQLETTLALPAATKDP